MPAPKSFSMPYSCGNPWHALHLRSLTCCIQVLGITIGICLASWFFAYVAFDLVSLTSPMLMGPQTDGRHLLAAASLGATLMMTRSPASAVGGVGHLEDTGFGSDGCPGGLVKGWRIDAWLEL